jgi:hypothetical protein
MHLTQNEIVSVINTWNEWYLLSHDENLLSEHSDSEVKIFVNPFDKKRLTEETMHDLKEYTDRINYTNNSFEINFTFSAMDHQASDIFKALKPVLEKSIGSEIEITNAMRFIEKGLPPESDDESNLNEELKAELKKYLDKQKEQKDDQTNDPDSSEETGKAEQEEMPYNSLEIKGTIKTDYIDIKEILHNNKTFDKIEIFLEASRLFETIERNHSEDQAATGKTDFECHDEAEAALASLHLGKTLDFGKAEYSGKLLKCSCLAEELAGIITFVRYRNDFELFSNPLLKRLKDRNKRAKEAQRALMKKSCSCFLYIFAILLFILLWMLFNKPKH